MKKHTLLYIITLLFVGCNDNDSEKSFADLVVYGKIFTSEVDGTKSFDDDSRYIMADAMAIKGGKFVYVGDKQGAARYIGSCTEVIDHTGKGMIVPGMTDGHAHYLMGKSIEAMGGITVSMNDSPTDFLNLVKAAYAKAKAEGKHSIYGSGWSYSKFLAEGMPTIQQLDAICPDVALFVNDEEVHRGLANSLCLRNAGIIDEKGNMVKSDIRGGEVCTTDGKANGLLLEQAGTYVRFNGIDFTKLLTLDAAKTALQESQKLLLANGYTCYMDGWSNYFGTNGLYQAAQSMEAAGDLHINLSYSYEIESWANDIVGEMDKAIDWSKKYDGPHLRSKSIKLFMDGTLEGGSGFTINEYTNGGHGIPNWTQEEMNDLVSKGNAKGLTMHIHAMGDAAVNRCVNAFENHGRKECRNTLVHIRNVLKSDFKRIADNGIYCTAGILWHFMSDNLRKMTEAGLPEGCKYTSYPIKSHLKAGTVVSSSSDYPATGGSPFNPFGIIEIAVRGANTNEKPWDTDELVSPSQALEIFTINGAKQLFLEKERGSIKVGKWADFVIVDKDILKCDYKDIHNTNVVGTWFEGKLRTPYNTK